MLSAPVAAGGSRRRDAAALFLGGGHRRFPTADPPFHWRLPLYPGGCPRPLEVKQALSPKSAPCAANVPRSPSLSLPSLRQPWERCAPGQTVHPLPTRHPWGPLPSLPALEDVTFTMWPERGVRHQGIWRILRNGRSSEVSCGAVSISRG